jgi:hypothetical protein
MSLYIIAPLHPISTSVLPLSLSFVLLLLLFSQLFCFHSVTPPKTILSNANFIFQVSIISLSVNFCSFSERVQTKSFNDFYIISFSNFYSVSFSDFSRKNFSVSFGELSSVSFNDFYNVSFSNFYSVSFNNFSRKRFNKSFGEFSSISFNDFYSVSLSDF